MGLRRTKVQRRTCPDVLYSSPCCTQARVVLSPVDTDDGPYLLLLLVLLFLFLFLLIRTLTPGTSSGVSGKDGPKGRSERRNSNGHKRGNRKRGAGIGVDVCGGVHEVEADVRIIMAVFLCDLLHVFGVGKSDVDAL